MKKRIYNLNEGAQVDEKSYIIVDKEGLPSAQKIQMSTFLKNVKEELNTNYISLWKPNTQYNVGDFVIYPYGDMDMNGVRHLECLKAHISDEEFFAYEDYWKDLGSLESSYSKIAAIALGIRAYDENTTETLGDISGKQIYDVVEFIGDFPNESDLKFSEFIEELGKELENKVDKETIGDIETALDSIIDIQNSLMGG